MSEPQAQTPTAAILQWYEGHRRDLPWRRTADPYAIWVSEVMLQQTQVATVVPYYARFLARFPTVEALASASLDDVLAVWQGLGYYARARNLHAAARIMVERHGGHVPGELQALRALPGMGDYIAAAVASIAFGADVPVVDANVARVLSRVYDYAGDVATATGKRALAEYAALLLPAGHASAYNQAMMELGATVCLARAPRCAACPAAAWCQSLKRANWAERPARRQRQPVPHRQKAALILCVEGRILLVRRRPQGLLGGLWELPAVLVLEGEAADAAAARVLFDGLGAEGRVAEEVALVRHGYTHFTEQLHVYRGELESAPTPASTWDDMRWVAPGDLAQVGLTGITRKALRALAWA